MVQKKDKCILAIDIGGSFIKWTLIDTAGINSQLPKILFDRTTINSQGSKNEILGTFYGILQEAFNKSGSYKLDIVGIGVSAPGPFDYENGISLMKHKFSNIYGVNIKRQIQEHFNLRNTLPIRFMVDSSAFLAGEASYGAARGFNRIIGITLGTGIGSAFMANRKIMEKVKGLPMANALCFMPYKGGIVEDKISKKAIIGMFKKLKRNGINDLDVEEIYKLAVSGDGIAIKVFNDFGETLGEIIKKVALDFKPECVVFGGGISKGFSLSPVHPLTAFSKTSKT